MRTLTTTVLAVSMLSVAGAVVVSAQEPSPGPSSAGQLVEVPEEAYAVAFPGGWETGAFPMEIGSDSPDGTSIEAVFRSAYGWAPDGSTQCLITNEPLNDPPGDPTMALEESADWALSHYEQMLIETSALDLPSGPAIRYVFESEGITGAAYLLSDGFDLFFLTCLGADPSDDRWLSIAETFEFVATSPGLDPVMAVATAEPTPTDPTPSGPLEPLGPTAGGGRTEMSGSGFVTTFPDDWTVELADPDPDVFAASPGTAWEALRATAPDGHMACSIVVGVAEVPFFDPPDRAGSGTGQGGVGKPFWDPDEPHLLWVPEPVVRDAHSSMQTTWDRLQDQDEDLAGDAAYSLLCVTSDASDAEPGGIFAQLMDSFGFLPEEE